MNIQENLDINDTVRVSSRAFEPSPYLERYDNPDMIRGIYAGRFFTIHNGEDSVQKYWTLRRKALIYDVPEKPVEISGPDVVPFLEKSICANHLHAAGRAWSILHRLYSPAQRRLRRPRAWIRFVRTA